jgi:hypothetical protein
LTRNGATNVRLGQLFRQVVAAELRDYWPGAEARPTAARNFDFTDDDSLTDIENLPFVVHVRHDQQPAWSSSLDVVEASARISGNGVGVLVEQRKGHSVDEAFAVMSLSEWAKLAARAYNAKAPVP